MKQLTFLLISIISLVLVTSCKTQSDEDKLATRLSQSKSLNAIITLFKKGLNQLKQSKRIQ